MSEGMSDSTGHAKPAQKGAMHVLASRRRGGSPGA